MGERVANQLLSPNMLNYIELLKEHSLEEIKIPSKMAEKICETLTFVPNIMSVLLLSLEKEK